MRALQDPEQSSTMQVCRQLPRRVSWGKLVRVMFGMIRRASCVGITPRVFVKIVLHRRPVAIVLAVALFGADSAMATVCEAYCASVGKKSFYHHSQAESTPSSPHHHMHAQQHGADCAECPKVAGQASLQLPDCGSFARVQALLENSRVFPDDHAVSQLEVAKSSTGSSLIPIQSERYSSLHSPPNISNFQPVLFSIRI